MDLDPSAPARRGPPAADPSVVGATEVCDTLAVDPAIGLTEAEAARRLAADGPNALRGPDPVPTWRKILAQFNDPLVHLLLVAVAVSVVAWVVDGASGVPVDAVVIVAIVVVNAALGYVQEARAEDAVAALSSMTAATSTVLRGGELRTVPATELVRGDVLVLAEGASVGADARLLAAHTLQVNEASLTGESEAVTKDPTTLEAPASLGDRHDMVFKGTAVVRGTGRAVVTGTGMQTEVGSVARLLEETDQEATPLQVEVARISRLLGVGVVVIALVVVATILLIGDVSSASELVQVLLLGVSLAVAAVPEGLPAILSVVLAIGVRRMARHQAVVKNLSAVEALGSASVICTDKTGTLTANEMTVQVVATTTGAARVSGVGLGPEGVVRGDEGPLVGDHLHEVQLLLEGGALANDAQLREQAAGWDGVGDPTDVALLVAARKLEGTPEAAGRHQRLGEVPFSSERKMMSVLVRTPDGSLVMVSKGAPDVLLAHCTHVQAGRRVRPLDAAEREARLAEVEELSAQAYRTLGVAYRRLGDTDQVAMTDAGELDDTWEEELVLVGVVGIIDPARPEVGPAIAEARRAGLRVVVITGDHPRTATRIAQDLGIVVEDDAAATGTDLDLLDDAELRQVAREVSVYARVSPEHKLRLVDALQADGEVVAMTGDGVNDAPALKSADIGVAMGITGTEVTKEAARMILADDNFATIVAAVRQGRIIFDNIRKFLRYLLSSNMGEVLTVFLGVVLGGVIGLEQAGDGSGLVLPLLATQILWINLITDSAPALAMGVDPEVDDVMGRPPRGPGERAIDGRMWRGILVVGLVMAAVTLLAMDLFLPGGLVEGHDSLEVARTAGFTTLVLAQLFNALNARSETASAFTGLFDNAWLWGAIGLGVVLQVAVVELPPLQAAFSTASLDLTHWAGCVVLASVVLWYDELRKAVLRTRDRHLPSADQPVQPAPPVSA